MYQSNANRKVEFGKMFKFPLVLSPPPSHPLSYPHSPVKQLHQFSSYFSTSVPLPDSISFAYCNSIIMTEEQNTLHLCNIFQGACLEGRIGLDDLQRSPPAPTILMQSQTILFCLLLQGLQQQFLTTPPPPPVFTFFVVQFLSTDTIHCHSLLLNFPFLSLWQSALQVEIYI